MSTSTGEANERRPQHSLVSVIPETVSYPIPNSSLRRTEALRPSRTREKANPKGEYLYQISFG